MISLIIGFCLFPFVVASYLIHPIIGVCCTVAYMVSMYKRLRKATAIRVRSN